VLGEAKLHLDLLERAGKSRDDLWLYGVVNFQIRTNAMNTRAMTGAFALCLLLASPGLFFFVVTRGAHVISRSASPTLQAAMQLDDRWGICPDSS